MKIAFIGAGRLARTLATAFHQAGWAVAAVASRSMESSRALAAGAGDCEAFASLQDAADAADMVFITVPDDNLEPVAASLRWRPGQSVVHCSGATEVSVLAGAQAQGALIGGFHPLQLFAEPSLALPRIRGSSVAIEAPPELEARLRALAESVGYRSITIPAGCRGVYHAATNYSGSFLLSLLREACDIWNGFGVSDEDALAAMLPLARGTLDAAESRGLAGALAGPISRGDAAVVRRHVADLARTGERAEQAVAFYRSIARRQLELAKEKGQLSGQELARLAAAIEGADERA